MRGENYVYEVAYELQEDLKSLSKDLGIKETESLIRKIIGALEALEWHVGRYEGRRREVGKLEEVVDRLETERVTRARERDLQDKDKTRLQELWSKESLELMRKAEKLEEENRELENNLKEAIDRKKLMSGRSEIMKVLMSTSTSEDNISRQNRITEVQNVHLRLKETIDTQQQEIRHLKKELAQRCVDFDAMQQECLQLSQVNAEFCDTICSSKLRAKRLMEEKANIEAATFLLKRNNNQDDEFEEIDAVFQDSDETMLKYDVAGDNKKEDDDVEPQFLWEEVQSFWWERERLRSEVGEKQERLQGMFAVEQQDDDREAEVQGPINKEPEEKLSPRTKFTMSDAFRGSSLSGASSSNNQDSGIRRFFQRILRPIESPEN